MKNRNVEKMTVFNMASFFLDDIRAVLLMIRICNR